MKLLVVIVNFRTASMTVDALRSLASEIASSVPIRVTVVDNASGDDSVNQIRNALTSNRWESWLSVMVLPRNGGFAWGNNSAIGPALQGRDSPEYIMLLNPDTMLRPGAITALLDFLNKNPSVGIAGSRLEGLNGSPQRSAFRFHTIWSELCEGARLQLLGRLFQKWQVAPPVRLEAHETDWVAGASMIIRREVFEKIGLLDDGYFLYFEETDFCMQAKRAGFSTWYVPTSRVVHLVGQASKFNDPNAKPQRKPVYWFESRRRFFRKNYGLVYALLADAAFTVGYLFYRLRRILMFKPVDDPPYYLWDLIRFNFLSFRG